MNTICGILGRKDAAVVRQMAGAMAARGEARHVVESRTYTLASAAPLPGETPCLLDGTPYNDDRALDAASLHYLCSGLTSPDALRLKGAFAAAVRVGDGWWLMRDRMGVKPLYYYELPNALLFASELKGLLAPGLFEKHLNLAAVDLYLTLRCVPGPESIIQGAKRVRPGHVLVYADGKTAEVQFAAFDGATSALDRASAPERLRELLEQASARGESDGMLWSAGIDTAALAAVRTPRSAVFVALKSSWQSEARPARESARALHVGLKTLKAERITEKTMAQVAYSLDEPVADASALPIYMIAEQAAQVGRTFTAGFGADELLGGFSRFLFLQKARGATGLVPMELVSEIEPVLPPNIFFQRGRNYLAAQRDPVEAYQSLVAVFDHAEREQLYTQAMKAVLFEKGGSAQVIRPHFLRKELTENLLRLDLHVGLPNLLLQECDRLAAAHGLELQLPYLDDDVVDLVLALPPRVKYGVISKRLLRQAVKGLVPPLVRLRARRGFRVPQSGPSLRVIDNFAKATITRERVETSGLFRWPFVSQVLSSSSHNVYRRRQFWALLMFFAWFREYMER